MRKVDELRGPSCLTNAKDDEPIFVLKSTDELAPNIIREWAHRYTNRKRELQGDLTAAQYAKRDEAFRLADEMDVWRRAHPTTGAE